MSKSANRAGFTMLEIMVVFGLIALATAMAYPRMQSWNDDARLRAMVRAATDAMLLARSEAVRTGDAHILFFATGAGTDPCGNALQDGNGNPVPMLILNDGAGALAGNCCIDFGETSRAIPATQGGNPQNWGTTFAGVTAPGDTGNGPMATGSTFTAPGGAPTNWVLFRADGVPVNFNFACIVGNVGTGGGAIYMTNGQRDYSAVLAPLGGVKVHAYERQGAAWN